MSIFKQSIYSHSNQLQAMKIQILIVFVSFMVNLSFGIDLKVLNIEKCYGNEKYLVIKRCEILDDNLFEVKAYLVSHVDSIVVSLII